MKIGLLAVVVLLLSAPAAKAATFCIAGVGMTPQCLYEDVTSCRQAATPPSTACIVNPEASLSYYGGSRYCTLNADRVASCIYTDRGQCNRNADNGAGICIDREEMADDISPFRYDNRIQN